MLKLSQRSRIVLLVMLLTLTIVFMFDDVLFYLLFERFLGFEMNLFGRSVVIALLTFFNLWLALLVFKSLTVKPRTGSEGMIGEKGIVDSVALSTYWVKVHGERWRARSSEALAAGDSVVVHKVEGLTLHVTREHTSANGGNA